ncbi:hypothetical protein OMAG_001253 [Candidatus Omnitrophus magneticus]|uniref:Uncharacterized protein n=1 Tax=Candidatus Omnitrophus magneticus TaxID=1609969 RepID=A0A0F0CTM2_9BACT|nr:hypothetical protein OMAG_001253 [Candidatus Omnitrophus magneticus]
MLERLWISDICPRKIRETQNILSRKTCRRHCHSCASRNPYRLQKITEKRFFGIKN